MYFLSVNVSVEIDRSSFRRSLERVHNTDRSSTDISSSGSFEADLLVVPIWYDLQ